VKRSDWPEAAEYVEKLSGKEGNRRPQLERLLEDCRMKRVDTVLVWKLDRFGRSTLDTLQNVKELERVGVRFFCPKMNIDTADSSPTGRFTLQVFAAIAELERAFILERTQGGFKAYQEAHLAGEGALRQFIARRGRHSKSGKDLPIGRPRKVVDVERVSELKAAGLSVRQVAAKLGIGRGTAQRLMAA
jgi:DNA invertase Pin-like site-specific DNA recombinase